MCTRVLDGAGADSVHREVKRSEVRDYAIMNGTRPLSLSTGYRFQKARCLSWVLDSKKPCNLMELEPVSLIWQSCHCPIVFAL